MRNYGDHGDDSNENDAADADNASIMIIIYIINLIQPESGFPCKATSTLRMGGQQRSIHRP